MRILAVFLLFASFLFPSCSNKSAGSTVSVAKPKTHKGWYDPKKDKKKKRTKVVQMKN
jgi:hypothetical protein